MRGKSLIPVFGIAIVFGLLYLWFETITQVFYYLRDSLSFLMLKAHWSYYLLYYLLIGLVLFIISMGFIVAIIAILTVLSMIGGENA